MLKFRTLFVILFPIFIYLLLSTDFRLKNEERTAVESNSDIATIACSKLYVTQAGAICDSNSDSPMHLDFPKVNLQSVLAGDEFLPKAKARFSENEKNVGNRTYRNVDFILRWEPNTPEFLQVYLNEYLPYWGNRVPYRLFWSARYEKCLDEDCTNKVVVNEKGEFLPSDIKDLDSNLAADTNFNGVPVAFWNMNVIP